MHLFHRLRPPTFTYILHIYPSFTHLSANRQQSIKRSKMCYQVWTHTLQCGERPLISNGEKEVVDSYAEPVPCSCQQEENIKPRFRCEDHGCCIVTAKILSCDGPQCKRMWKCHFYQPSKKADASTWGNYAVLDAWFLSRKLWSDARHIPQETPLFVDALLSFRRAGRAVTTTHHRLSRAKSTYDDLNQQWEHCEECSRTHDPFNCRLLSERFMEEQQITSLKGTAARYRRDLHYSCNALKDRQFRGERCVSPLPDYGSWLKGVPASDCSWIE